MQYAQEESGILHVKFYFSLSACCDAQVAAVLPSQQTRHQLLKILLLLQKENVCSITC
jgi:hypothetical protein